MERLWRGTCVSSHWELDSCWVVGLPTPPGPPTSFVLPGLRQPAAGTARSRAWQRGLGSVAPSGDPTAGARPLCLPSLDTGMFPAAQAPVPALASCLLPARLWNLPRVQLQVFAPRSHVTFKSASSAWPMVPVPPCCRCQSHSELHLVLTRGLRAKHATKPCLSFPSLRTEPSFLVGSSLQGCRGAPQLLLTTPLPHPHRNDEHSTAIVPGREHGPAASLALPAPSRLPGHRVWLST